MFKSLIVDDEKNIRERLVKFFPWDEVGFQVVDTAENGEEALEMITASPPEVVLTDIMMPKMNGLELAEQLSIKYPNIKVIILSAYDDFSYAQQAIESGVKGYMLKPLLKKDFYDVMNKIANELKEDRVEQKQNGSNEERVLNILKGEQLESYKHTWHQAYHRVVIFSFEEMVDVTITFSLRQAIMEHANCYWEKRNMPVVFYGNNLTVIFSAPTPIAKIDIRSVIDDFSIILYEKIKEMTEQKLTFAVGVGNMVRKIEDINKSYSEAVYAYSYKYFSPGETVLFFQDLAFSGLRNSNEMEVGSEENQLQEIEKEILEAVLSQRSEQIPSAVQRYFEIIPRLKKNHVSDVREACYGFMMQVFFHMKEKEYILPSVDQNQVLRKVYDLQSLNELKKWFKHVLELITADRTRNQQQHYNPYVTFAMEYVRKNYANKITLKGMADQLFIHQVYFSTIFKQETGENFIDYVNKVRVEKASDLIRTTDQRMKDISGSTGFQSHSYFNKVFKRVTGFSPLYFRKKSK